MAKRTTNLHFKSAKTQAEIQTFANVQRFHEKQGKQFEFVASMRVIEAAYKANIITQEDFDFAVKTWEGGSVLEAMFIEFSN
jgi:hypothetical protein